MLGMVNMFKKTVFLLLVLAIVPLTSDAKSASKTDKALEVGLKAYSLAVRWNDFEAASESIDPNLVKGERFSEQDESYYKNFQISGYTLKTSAYIDPAHYTQRIELRIIDQNTQVERTKIDKQSWRFDVLTKRWWLTSGLPKLE
jgi:hypothetical protein